MVRGDTNQGRETFADKYSFFNRKLEVQNNKIYALDSGWTLRVYEKEG
jgi:hypothetical protein